MSNMLEGNSAYILLKLGEDNVFTAVSGLDEDCSKYNNLLRSLLDGSLNTLILNSIDNSIKYFGGNEENVLESKQLLSPKSSQTRKPLISPVNTINIFSSYTGGKNAKQ